MKRWQGVLFPLPLGSRFGKENLAWKLQDPLTPGTPNMAEREEEERQMCVAGRWDSRSGLQLGDGSSPC